MGIRTWGRRVVLAAFLVAVGAAFAAGVASADTVPGGWVRAAYPSDYKLFDAAVIDAQTACVIGPNYLDWRDSAIFRTTDGGASWTKVWQAAEAVSQERPIIAFASPSLGWALTESRLLRSTDAGMTWETVLTGSFEQYGVATSGSTVWLMALGGGSARVSTDAGATWNSISTPVKYAYPHALLTEQTIVTAGEGGKVWRTDDGGVTWTQPAQVTTKTLWALTPVSPTLIWAAGEDGTVIRSVDAGLTWKRVATDLRGVIFKDIAGSPDGRFVWAVGFANKVGSNGQTYLSGILAQSTDGGASWQVDWALAEQILFAVSMTDDASFGIAAGQLTDIEASSVPVRGTRKAGTRAAEVLAYRPDTKRPTTKAPSAAKAVRGRKATIKFTVSDPRPTCGFANVAITIKGPQTKTITLKRRAVNKALTAEFTCKLARGTYRFTVYATDLAGNKQARAGTNVLTVK